jgi:glycosyltransferase involved in cell wall biosynthesis
MRIGVLVAFAGRSCGGPEVYEREIVRAFSAVAPQNEYHLYCLNRGARAVIGVPEDRVTYHELRSASRVVSMFTSLPLALSRTKPEGFFAPVIPPPFCPPNTLMTIQCSSLLRHPTFYPPLIRWRLRFLLHRAARKAAKVICPSEHVRDAVREGLGLPDERLAVIYPGVSASFRPLDPADNRAYLADKYGIRFPYLLLSGRWERRKNVLRTLEAFALFKKNARTEHRFVSTGGGGWAEHEGQRVIQRLGIQDHFVNLGKSSLDDLPYLYSGADAVLYASLWEGFGLPIVEAMACGCPVVTSNVAAMPETAGGAALLVNPHSTEEIAAAIERIVTEPGLGTRLRALGLERARNFSWENTARQTLDLYSEIAGYNSRFAVAR